MSLLVKTPEVPASTATRGLRPGWCRGAPTSGNLLRRMVHVSPRIDAGAAEVRSRRGRLPLAPWWVSLALHAVALGALSASPLALFKAPSLYGAHRVVSVELLATFVAAQPEAVEDQPFPVEVATPQESRAERMAACLPPLRPAEPLVREHVRPLSAPRPLARRADEPPRDDPPPRLPLDRARQPRRPPMLVAAAVASAHAIGLEPNPPQPLDNPQPVYPPTAIANGWQGRVLLRLSVGAAGSVEKVDIVQSSGVSILDEAAVAAVRQWRFRPATQGAVAVGASVLLPVVFDLSNWSAARAVDLRE